MISARRGRLLMQPPPNALPILTGKDFRAFQELILRESGIYLSDAKKALLIGRLARRIRDLRMESFDAYLRRITIEDPLELAALLDRISTNETRFFREPNQFEFLRRNIYPSWKEEAHAGRRSRSIRVWSAACSSGEEPYSIAMDLLESFSLQEWSLEIIASDLSTRMLARAREGVWPIEKSKQLPIPLLQRYMMRGIGQKTGTMKACDELRSKIDFRRINLNDLQYPLSGAFDIIFCRNVMIYFRPETRDRIVRQLVNRLTPGGLLFVGHAENLNMLPDVVTSVAPNVYTTALPSAPRVAKRATIQRRRLVRNVR